MDLTTYDFQTGRVINLDKELLQEAKEERDKWKEELLSKFGDILPITLD